MQILYFIELYEINLSIEILSFNNSIFIKVD